MKTRGENLNDIFQWIDQKEDFWDVQEKEKSEMLVCECYCVSLQEILSFCEGDILKSMAPLKEKFFLGRGCGTCLKDEQKWINVINQCLSANKN